MSKNAAFNTANGGTENAGPCGDQRDDVGAKTKANRGSENAGPCGDQRDDVGAKTKGISFSDSEEEQYFDCDEKLSPRQTLDLCGRDQEIIYQREHQKHLVNGFGELHINEIHSDEDFLSLESETSPRNEKDDNVVLKTSQALSTIAHQNVEELISPFVIKYLQYQLICEAPNIPVDMDLITAAAAHSVVMEKRSDLVLVNIYLNRLFPGIIDQCESSLFIIYRFLAADYKKGNNFGEALKFCYRAYAQLDIPVKVFLNDMIEFCAPLKLYVMMLPLKDRLQLLSELCDMANFYMMKKNPFCMIICSELKVMYIKSRVKQNENIIHKELRKVYTIFALFFKGNGGWNDCMKFCKTALEDLCDYDDPVLLEIWSVALWKTGKTKIALKKAQDALSHLKVEKDKLRLQQHIDKLKSELVEIEATVAQNTKEPDDDWLRDTNVLTSEKQRQENAKMNVKANGRKKKSRTRPKRRSCSDTASVTSESSYMTNGPGLSCTDKWDQPGKKGNSVFNDYILNRFISQQNSTNNDHMTQPVQSKPVESEELEVINVSDSENESHDSDVEDGDHYGVPPAVVEDCVVQKRDENIYEESKRLHLEHKKVDNIFHRISVGQIDLSDAELAKYNEVKFRRKTNQEPYYETAYDEQQLKNFLRRDPRKYIHCTIDFKSSHLAMCKPVESCFTEEIEIHGRSRCGHNVFNGDEVVVEIIQKNEPNKKQQNSGNMRKNNATFGKVLGPLKHHRRNDQRNPVFVCSVDPTASYLMKPLCKTVPKIEVFHSRIKKKFPGHAQKYKVEIWQVNKNGELQFRDDQNINPVVSFQYLYRVAYVNWSRYHCYPQGAVVEVIPCSTDINTGDIVLRMQYNVPYLYGRDAVKETEFITQDGELHDEMCRLRKDFSNLQTFTIDPEHSEDLDDALSFEQNPDGTVCVGVHIADVASTVLKNTGLDKEAFSRSQSFYPPDKQTIHMFPSPVVKACSLLPGVKRKAVSLFFTYEKDSCKLKKEPLVCCSTICSSRQLTYTDVQNVIEKRSEKDEFTLKLQKLSSLAQLLRTKRLKGASNAVLYEDVFFHLGELYMRSPEAHQLVEEFMIETNRYIAKYLLKKFPQCVPLRVQHSPKEEMIQQFVSYFGEPAINSVLKLQNRLLNDYSEISVNQNERAHVKVKLPIVDTVWKALKKAAEENNQNGLKNIICMDAIHPIQQLVIDYWISIQERAEYCCSGEFKNPDGRKHFDLNLDAYSQFTSPIRRFNDLLVHRMVHAALKNENCPYSMAEVRTICQSLTVGAKQAKDYRRKINQHKIAEKLRKQSYPTYAFVKAISDEGLVLSAPSLSGVNLEVSYSSLGVRTVPTLGEDCSASFIPTSEFVRIKWDKTVFHCNGRPSYSIIPRNVERNKEFTVDPLNHTVMMSLKDWSAIIISFLKTQKNDSRRLKRLIEAQSELTTHKRSMLTVRDVSSEINKEDNGEWKNFSCCLSQTFMIGQAVKLQLSASLKEAMLVPSVQLISVAPSFNCCTQHIKDSVNCFAKYEVSPTSENYYSLDEYLQTWLPLMLMESASESVQNEENVIINDVKTCFKYSEEKGGIVGQLTLQLNYCEERNIEFGGKNIDQIGSKDEEEEKTYLSSVDFLCIRCTLERSVSDSVLTQQQFTWIGHGQIDSVRKKKKSNRVIVYFNLRKDSQQLPHNLLGEKTCSIEIIPKTETSRREEYCMKMITNEKETSELAQDFVLSMDNIPKLEKSHLVQGIKSETDMESGIPEKPMPSNNINQLNAIEKALTSSITLIQGPPGTGKTYTGSKLICLFNKINGKLRIEGGKKKQVLFCGPSNNSVDVMAKFLLTRISDCERPKMLRIHGTTEVYKDFPIPKRRKLKISSARLYKMDDMIRNISLHYLIRRPSNKYAKDIKTFDVKFRQHPDKVTVKEIKQYKKLIVEAEKEEIPKYDVLFCTCCVAGNGRLVSSSSVYQCIVDESGMCTEPQTLTPIIAHKVKQIVLIGDHKQLRPIIHCAEAAELGLEKSMFERYSEKACFLNMQYRMHPEICTFPSRAFYGGKLRTGYSIYWNDDFPLKLWPKEQFPHLFIHVEGDEESLTVSTAEGNEKSKSNKKEVEEVVKMFKLLVEKERKKPEYIMILSQYKSQCNEIKKALEKERYIDFKVSTVVSSQGGEWDYVIFSTVRSLPHYMIEPHPTLGWCKHNLGFTADEHQMNVALTRARKGLIIIGNKHLLRCDRNWKKLLAEYESKGCVKEPNEVPKTMKIYLKTEIAPRFQRQLLQQQTAEEFYRDTDRESEYAESQVQQMEDEYYRSEEYGFECADSANGFEYADSVNGFEYADSASGFDYADGASSLPYE